MPKMRPNLLSAKLFERFSEVFPNPVMEETIWMHKLGKLTNLLKYLVTVQDHLRLFVLRG